MTPGTLKIFGYPFTGRIERGERLELLTRDGERAIVTVEDRDGSGVVLRAPKTCPEDVVSLASAGAVRLYGAQPRVEWLTPSLPRGHLAVAGTARGAWQHPDERLVPDGRQPLTGSAWTATIAAPDAPFLFTELVDPVHRRDAPPRCAIGRFELD